MRLFFSSAQKAKDERTKRLDQITGKRDTATFSKVDEAVLLLAKERGLTPEEMGEAIRSYTPPPEGAATTTVRELVDQHLAHQRDVMKRSARTIKNLRWKLGGLCKACAGIPAALIRPEDIRAFLEGVPELETRRSHYLGATGFFGWATQRGFLPAAGRRLTI